MSTLFLPKLQEEVDLKDLEFEEKEIKEKPSNRDSENGIENPPSEKSSSSSPKN